MASSTPSPPGSKVPSVTADSSPSVAPNAPSNITNYDITVDFPSVILADSDTMPIRSIDYASRISSATEHLALLQADQRKLEEEIELYKILDKKSKDYLDQWLERSRRRREMLPRKGILEKAVKEIAVLETKLVDIIEKHEITKLNLYTDVSLVKMCHYSDFVCDFDKRNKKEVKNDVELMELNVKLIREYLDIQLATVDVEKKRNEVASLKLEIETTSQELHTMAQRFQNLALEIKATAENLTKNHGLVWIEKDISETRFHDIKKTAYDQGCRETEEKFLPLIKAGAHIRGRQLEQSKVDKKLIDNTVVELGHTAAHRGNVLADAALYQDWCPVKRTDIETFQMIYRRSPTYIWKCRQVDELIVMFDWLGSVRQFCRTEEYFQNSRFLRKWKYFWHHISEISGTTNTLLHYI